VDFLVSGALELLVDAKETDLMHCWKLGNQVDDRGNQDDKEGEGSVVSVVGAEQEPKSRDKKVESVRDSVGRLAKIGL